MFCKCILCAFNSLLSAKILYLFYNSFKVTVHHLQKCLGVYTFTLPIQCTRFIPSKDFLNLDDFRPNLLKNLRNHIFCPSILIIYWRMLKAYRFLVSLHLETYPYNFPEKRIKELTISHKLPFSTVYNFGS